MHATQMKTLRSLDDWVTLLNDKFEQQVAIKRDSCSAPSAAKLGLKELVIGLGELWRKRSDKSKFPIGPNSPWILFLQQSLKEIAQRTIGYEAACKLTRGAVKNPIPVADLSFGPNPVRARRTLHPPEK